MIGRLRQLSEPRLRQQAGIEKSQTPVERTILVLWVRIHKHKNGTDGCTDEQMMQRLYAPPKFFGAHNKYDFIVVYTYDFCGHTSINM